MECPGDVEFPYNAKTTKVEDQDSYGAFLWLVL